MKIHIEQSIKSVDNTQKTAHTNRKKNIETIQALDERRTIKMQVWVFGVRTTVVVGQCWNTCQLKQHKNNNKE